VIQYVSDPIGEVMAVPETTGQGVDIYKVDTNYNGFYDLKCGSDGTNGIIQWSANIQERVPAVGKDFVPVQKEAWVDWWTNKFLAHMKSKIILGLAFVLCGVWSGCAKIDEQVETGRLSSDEILENHTHYEGGGMAGQRFNKVFLKNPTAGTSELIGNLNYEANPDHSSLLERFPHPQEIVRGDKKVLIIGPYVCKRW